MPPYKIYHFILSVREQKKEQALVKGNMFLDKIKSGQSGILTYGITPPKDGTTPEKVQEIAEKTMARIIPLDIDALVVYDVQDESARTAAERPFPFMNALDPLGFSKQYLQDIKAPKIIYRPAGKYSKEELGEWLNDIHNHQFFPVFVGVPAADFEVKVSLPEAYQLWQKYQDSSAIGAVTIPERHAILQDEDKRILDKASSGVSFFISQCVFNLDYAKKMVDDLCATCTKEGATPPTLIFTLTVCGSLKTLRFMEWLGIHIPDTLKDQLVASDNMLEDSLKVCLDNAAALISFCSEKCVPFGFNIESLAIRKDEINASIDLVSKIGTMLNRPNSQQEISAPVSVSKENE